MELRSVALVLAVSALASGRLASPLPYEAIGSIDVGTGESSIFMFNNQTFAVFSLASCRCSLPSAFGAGGVRGQTLHLGLTCDSGQCGALRRRSYLLDNIFCGYIDHYGQWDPRFKGHSYARIRHFDTGAVVANVTETIATSFVSAFVDHRDTGDLLWLSALDEDRCVHQCGTGVLAISSADLVSFSRHDAIPSVHTCNTEVARVYTPPPPGGLPPHRYVMILEPFTFMVNNNADGNLTHGWVPATGSKAPHAPGGGPSIRFEGGHYYVITGGTTVYLCRSKDLGMTDAWACTTMVVPTDKGGAPGPGDGAVAPYVGFAKDAARKDFPVMQKNLSAWDWNSNDADVCCTGGYSPSFLVWGASTQGRHPNLPKGSPSCTNAIGRANVTLKVLLDSFFAT